MKAPMVATYRASWLTYGVYRTLVRAPHVALPNILASRRIVPERLQQAATAEGMAAAVRPLLTATPEREAMVRALSEVHASLGEPGASGRVAKAVLTHLLPAPPTVRELSP
jgi:lipid-A-disaccharide synthase